MYRINLLNRPVLITVDEVITQAAVDQNADIRLILNNIIVAEERFIVPLFGNAFYKDFVNRKNVKITDGNKADLLALINDSLTAAGKDNIELSDLITGQWVNAIELVDKDNLVELWEQYLWKIVAECVDVQTTLPSWLRHTGQGQQKNNPVVIGGNTEGSATGDRKDIEYKIDAMIQSRINPLILSMTNYICETGGFTLLKDGFCGSCGCGTGDSGGKPFRGNTGGVVMGIYDD